MPKTFFNFDGELFNVFGIEKVERFEKWDEIENIQNYGIVINRDIPHGVSAIIDLEFLYTTYEEREQKLKSFKERLSAFDHIIVI